MKIRQQSAALWLAVCSLAFSPAAWADNDLLKLRFNFDAAPVDNVVVDQLGRHHGTVAGAQWAAAEDGRSGVMRFIVPVVPQIIITPTSEFDGTEGTIAFWMKSGPNSGPGNDGAILFDRRSSLGDVIVLLNNGTLLVQASGGPSFATTKVVNDDQWHHITYVFDQTATGGTSI